MRTQFSEAEPTVLKVQFIASFHDRKVISQAACAKDDDRVAPRDLPVVPHLAFDVGRHMYCDSQSTEMIRQASMSVFCLRDTEVGIETLPAACEGVPPSRVGPLDTAANHRPRSVLPGSLWQRGLHATCELADNAGLQWAKTGVRNEDSGACLLAVRSSCVPRCVFRDVCPPELSGHAVSSRRSRGYWHGSRPLAGNYLSCNEAV